MRRFIVRLVRLLQRPRQSPTNSPGRAPPRPGGEGATAAARAKQGRMLRYQRRSRRAHTRAAAQDARARRECMFDQRDEAAAKEKASVAPPGARARWRRLRRRSGSDGPKHCAWGRRRGHKLTTSGSNTFSSRLHSSGDGSTGVEDVRPQRERVPWRPSCSSSRTSNEKLNSVARAQRPGRLGKAESRRWRRLLLLRASPSSRERAGPTALSVDRAPQLEVPDRMRRGKTLLASQSPGLTAGRPRDPRAPRGARDAAQFCPPRARATQRGQRTASARCGYKSGPV